MYGHGTRIISEQLVRLYAIATDEETTVLDGLALRASIKWCCACGWHNAEQVHYCEDCRNPRPGRGS